MVNKGAVKCQVYNVWNVKPILKCFVWQNIIMFANKWISNIRTTLTDWLYYCWQQAYICALNVPDLTYVHLKLARFSLMNYVEDMNYWLLLKERPISEHRCWESSTIGFFFEVSWSLLFVNLVLTLFFGLLVDNKRLLWVKSLLVDMS